MDTLTRHRSTSAGAATTSRYRNRQLKEAGESDLDTWWIDEPHLAGSRNPTTADLEQLKQDGFTVLISLLKEDEQKPSYDPVRAAGLGFTRHNIPVGDLQPPTVDQLEHLVRLIESVPDGTKTVVHCEGGRGRTGTFAAAYWVARGVPVDDAIARIRRVRRGAVETSEQEATVRQFADRRRDAHLIPP